MKQLSGGAAVVEPDSAFLSEGTRRFRLPISSEMGARGISQSVSVYDPGVSPSRRNPTAEEVLYVVRGYGICYIDGYRYELEPGVGVYIPPASIFAIEARDLKDAPLEVVGACCPEEAAEIGAVARPREFSETQPFRTVREAAQKAIPTGDREFKLLISQETGASRVTQFVGSIPPGRAPMHHHTYEEVIYVLQGTGVVWTEGASAEYGPGASIYLPRGVSHSLENSGRSPVKLLGVFHPSGSPAARYDD